MFRDFLSRLGRDADENVVLATVSYDEPVQSHISVIPVCIHDGIVFTLVRDTAREAATICQRNRVSLYLRDGIIVEGDATLSPVHGVVDPDVLACLEMFQAKFPQVWAGISRSSSFLLVINPTQIDSPVPIASHDKGHSMLDLRDIEDLFVDINGNLMSRGVKETIYVVGCAALLLHERSFTDVRFIDVFYKESKQLQESIREVLALRNLDKAQINNGFETLYDSPKLQYEDYCIYSNLTVKVLTLDALTAFLCAVCVNGESPENRELLAIASRIPSPSIVTLRDTFQRYYSPETYTPVLDRRLKNLLASLC